MSHDASFMGRVGRSLILTVIGIIVLYSSAVIVTMLAPQYVDPTWTQPSSYFQVQMYEISDPQTYISNVATGSKDLHAVKEIKNGFTLLSFEESENTRIIAPKELESYITHYNEKLLKLTPRLLLLRPPQDKKKVDEVRKKLQEGSNLDYTFLELYDPGKEEAFVLLPGDGTFEDFVDSNYVILKPSQDVSFHHDPGVIYVKNPIEYKITYTHDGWMYDPLGEPVKDRKELVGKKLGFRSRKELIAIGEQIYAQEGCWYCHTDQTRTLVQDTVLNGAAAFPAPPSSPNEYIYQEVTFPGTRRIGPDLSRVAIKRPSRDWHKSHFWSPKTASMGSIMPAFHHFFDDDPRGSSKNLTGIPNYRFEAIFQYLMTKGTRITPPTEAWWLGKDPVNTLKIIEGRK